MYLEDFQVDDMSIVNFLKAFYCQEQTSFLFSFVFVGLEPIDATCIRESQAVQGC